jgi:hypothetical protein
LAFKGILCSWEDYHDWRWRGQGSWLKGNNMYIIASVFISYYGETSVIWHSLSPAILCGTVAIFKYHNIAIRHSVIWQPPNLTFFKSHEVSD